MVLNAYSANKIHDTVLKVSAEAKMLLPEIPVIKDEMKLLSELVLCILSSQEKYEVAVAMMKALKKGNIILIPNNRKEFALMKNRILNCLKNPVYFTYNGKQYFRKLRFNLKKTNYIINTLENIYLQNLTLRKILNNVESKIETRKIIIAYSHGIGPKQASMFLRNIGYSTEFAILDTHIIDYMQIIGLANRAKINFSSISSYQKVESALKSYAENYNIRLLHLDLAIWTTMRTLKNLH